MPLTRIDVRGSSRRRPRACCAATDSGPGADSADLTAQVSEILDLVRAGGDKALIELTERLDHVTGPALSVGTDEIRKAAERISPGLLESLEVAWDRLLSYHRHQGAPAAQEYDDGKVRIRELVRPVDRAGLYAPGGLALYPSSVLMCAAPATVAGVERARPVRPPGQDGILRPRSSRRPRWPE